LVAAVCFRILSTGIEFLLVRTRQGRWTFPKGGVEPGLTPAQSAALEAHEEAGVHGRIEEIAFVRYKLRKSAENGTQDCLSGYLCEVLHLGPAQEANRNPTWFSPQKTKRRLAQGRTEENAAELSRVVDRALARIQRSPARSMLANDPMVKVRFEASEINIRRPYESLAHPQSSNRNGHGTASGNNDRGRGKILQLRPAQITRP
jgi:8-oxo-dGTP pyrophosphatase MutT (NUDIX family)